MITKTKQLEEQLTEKSAELEKTQKEFRYKLSDISMELKAQQDRFSREIEKTKVNFGIQSNFSERKCLSQRF